MLYDSHDHKIVVCNLGLLQFQPRSQHIRRTDTVSNRFERVDLIASSLPPYQLRRAGWVEDVAAVTQILSQFGVESIGLLLILLSFVLLEPPLDQSLPRSNLVEQCC